MLAARARGSGAEQGGESEQQDGRAGKIRPEDSWREGEEEASGGNRVDRVRMKRGCEHGSSAAADHAPHARGRVAGSGGAITVGRKVVWHNSHLTRIPYNHYFRPVSRHAAGFSPLIPVERNAERTLYRQVYDALRSAILGRRLAPGQQVPSTRALAAELGISRISVLNSYAQLLAEGYLEARTGAGTFVSKSLPGQAARNETRGASGVAGNGGPRRVSRAARMLPRSEKAPWVRGQGAFSLSEPAMEAFPLRVWSNLVLRNCRNPRASSFQYGDPLGHAGLREAIAAYLRTTRAVRCEPRQVMVVSGSQQALDLTVRVLLDAGSRVWVEEPGYWLARHALIAGGCEIVPVPVDAEGLDVAAGIERCRTARAAFVAPSHQFPLGVAMSASRRLQLLEWAQRGGAWIVEDDYDSEYRYGSKPIASLQGLDAANRVIYIGTFSKVLFPSLRVGYVVIPEDLAGHFLAVRGAMDVSPPYLMQAVLADFIAEGHFSRHIRRMRILYGQRRDALVEALEREFGREMRWMGSEAGMHLTLLLPRGYDDRAIALRAAREDLWLWPLSPAYSGTTRQHGFILGFGSTTPGEMPRAVRRLRNLLAR